jgi:N-acetylneuraminic acid mutarotase
VRKLALAIVLVLVLVGGSVGGWAVANVGAATPSLTAYGSTAPGFVCIRGSDWTRGVPVDLWMDMKDDAHHVAVATPSSRGIFQTCFMVGPTTLGGHTIIGKQGTNPDVVTPFKITSTQQVDDRITDAWQSIEDKLDDPATGLGEIKAEVNTILSILATGGGPTPSLHGNMLMGLDNDAELLASGYTQLYPHTEYYAPSPTGELISFWADTSQVNAPEARAWHTAVWTGSKMIVWGGLNDSGDMLNDGGIYDPTTNAWTAMSTDGAPEARAWHTAVWTDSKMIVWGGMNDSGDMLNDGGIYDPTTNAWTAMSTDGAPEARAWHTAVWTGSKMIVWGGWDGTSFDHSYNLLNDGGIYDPDTDIWTPISPDTTGGDPDPSARQGHTAVWTDSQMIVCGGEDDSGTPLADGGRYDPAANSWIGMSPVPSSTYARSYHTALWTGSEMIIWGGRHVEKVLSTGGLYDPVADDWTLMSETGAPSGRFGHTAVWTGSEMIVWGGSNGTSEYGDGGIYNPATDTWRAVSTVGAPSARVWHTAVWTGSQMVVWGGVHDLNTPDPTFLNDGGRYSEIYGEYYYYYVKQ